MADSLDSALKSIYYQGNYPMLWTHLPGSMKALKKLCKKYLEHDRLQRGSQYYYAPCSEHLAHIRGKMQDLNGRITPTTRERIHSELNEQVDALVEICCNDDTKITTHKRIGKVSFQQASPRDWLGRLQFWRR